LSILAITVHWKRLLRNSRDEIEYSHQTVKKSVAPLPTKPVSNPKRYQPETNLLTRNKPTKPGTVWRGVK
jgi:hypothetical protein